LLDGAPIRAVAIISKRNRKTGAMVQTYIMRDDMNPLDANKSGADFSICGNCPLRGIATNDEKAKQAKKRKCYVVLGQGPLGVYKTFKKGKYPAISGHDAIADFGAGLMVRIGTYGDGSAVPSYIWESLISQAIGHTGYSHQSEMPQSGFNPALYMVSVESESQARAAWDKGFRTFRIGNAPIAGKEIVCPSNRGVQCADCGLCAGNSNRAKSIVIPAHGVGATHFANAA
jgi:hypothetical protein